MISYKLPLPHLTITMLEGEGVSRNCYRETVYELICRFPLSTEHFTHLDACGLIGFGQAYQIIATETFYADGPAVEMERGKIVNEHPTRPDGSAYEPNRYEYHRYKVRRICDSGD